MKKYKYLVIGILAIACVSAKPKFGPEMIDHSLWTALLQEHVSETGEVDYAGFVADSTRFNAYLELLSTHHPDPAMWRENARLAYWINVYNAFTVKLIVDHYPVASIKDIGGSIYKVNTAWDIKHINIGGTAYDLNNVEHSILRKKFREPRIHFAINCASESCPKLHNRAYEASKLDQQLTDAAIGFINDPNRNILSNEHAQLSKIFKWFKDDFTENRTLVEFINLYAESPMPGDVDIDYLDYSWSLNGKAVLDRE